MPCYETTYVKVSFRRADRELVNETIRELRLSAWLSIDGELIAESQQDIAKIKAAYAKKVAARVAKRKGWKVQQDKKNPQKLYIRR